ncbi:hypothetical protein [Cytobacillus oceanisediminis]|jgi:4-aminobutyrate aminotransferase/(S)-3-amino-2-methylpropionate transaminase|uniref:hypothetical protein n=1 Tax=Cytobacillus oceanisediminis TaxID=665099 RepID=UPI00215B0A2D|nr:hypothetical protein [Cytobacillus oceanisediminis]
MKTVQNKKFIDLKTSIPGPKAMALLAEKEQHVHRGPFNTMPTFTEKGEGAL